MLLGVFEANEDLLIKGFTLQGVDVLHMFNFYPPKWVALFSASGNLFPLFQKPGVPLLQKHTTHMIERISGDVFALAVNPEVLTKWKCRSDRVIGFGVLLCVVGASYQGVVLALSVL